MDRVFNAELAMWKISFDFLYQELDMIDETLSEIADAVCSYEISSSAIEPSGEDQWRYEAYFTHVPRLSKISELLLHVTQNHYALVLEKVVDRDWVMEAQRNFTPIITEDFFIASDYYSDDCPDTKELIVMNPGRAFGTGDHATTQGCIEALVALKDKKISTIADIGCGTGVLAIAAAKYWQDAKIIGCDIEEIAVQISQENARINNIKAQFKTQAAEQYLANIPKQQLILANILAKPLINISQLCYNTLSRGGYIILSGFLDNQKASILSSFLPMGFEEINTLNKDSWISLTLQKVK